MSWSYNQMHSSPWKIPAKADFNNHGYGMARGNSPVQEQFSSFSSSDGSSSDTSMNGNPFMIRSSTVQMVTESTRLPYEPPKCRFGPIAPPISRQHIELPWYSLIYENTHIPSAALLAGKMDFYSKGNVNRNSSKTPLYPVNSPSKPWKELSDASSEDFFGTDINEFFSPSSDVMSSSNSNSSNDFHYQSNDEDFELQFAQPSPVQKVQDYKSFREPFGQTRQRSSTPIRCLTEDFEEKCSLYPVQSSLNSQADSYSDSEWEYIKKCIDEKFNEEMEPKPSLRNKRKRGPKLHIKTTGCSYCLKTGQPDIITDSHTLKDIKGRTLCPYLRVLVCSMCQGDGDYAHIPEDCPALVFMESPPKKCTRPKKEGVASKAHRRLNFS